MSVRRSFLAPLVLAVALAAPVARAPARGDDEAAKPEPVEQLLLMETNGVYLRIDALGADAARIRIVFRGGPPGTAPMRERELEVPDEEGARRPNGKPAASASFGAGVIFVRLGDRILMELPFSGQTTLVGERELWRRFDALRVELRAHPMKGFEVDRLVDAADLFMQAARLDLIDRRDLDEVAAWLGRRLAEVRDAYVEAAKDPGDGVGAEAMADAAVRTLEALVRAVEELPRARAEGR